MQNMLKNPGLIMLALLWVLVHAPARGQNTRTDSISGSGVSFDLVLVPGGTFDMGSPPDDVKAQPNEQPLHLVRLDSFWMGTHEVSYDEFIVFYHLEKDSDTSTHPDSMLEVSGALPELVARLQLVIGVPLKWQAVLPDLFGTVTV